MKALLQMDSSTASDCATLGDIDGLRRLLNLGGDVEDMDSDGNTALHRASEAGQSMKSVLQFDE